MSEKRKTDEFSEWKNKLLSSVIKHPWILFFSLSSTYFHIVRKDFFFFFPSSLLDIIKICLRKYYASHSSAMFFCLFFWGHTAWLHMGQCVNQEDCTPGEGEARCQCLVCIYGGDTRGCVLARARLHLLYITCTGCEPAARTTVAFSSSAPRSDPLGSAVAMRT